jgi:hypothetical protein
MKRREMYLDVDNVGVRAIVGDEGNLLLNL